MKLNLPPAHVFLLIAGALAVSLPAAESVASPATDVPRSDASERTDALDLLEMRSTDRPLAIASDRIASIQLEFPGADPLLLERDRPGATFVASAPHDHRQVDAEKLNGLLDTLLEARFDDVREADDEDALRAREHARRVILLTFDGNDYTLLIGRRPAEVPPDSAGNDGSRSVEASIIFDQDGNIVEPPDPEPQEREPESDPGPVFILYKSTDPEFLWTRISTNAALQFPEEIHAALPDSPNDLLKPSTPHPPEDR